MSQADRDKWNRRYREGAYADRPHPSVILADWVEKLPMGRALDVACGAGRNALFLAKRGYEVDAVDISREALQRGAESAAEQGITVNWLETDLEEPLTLRAPYDLIVMVRYVNLALLKRMSTWLAAGGVLVCEEHLQTNADVIGPQNPAFRVDTGALEAAAAGLDILHLEEGLVTEPDGRLAALSRLIARHP